jgi:hypothetical protein
MPKNFSGQAHHSAKNSYSHRPVAGPRRLTTSRLDGCCHRRARVQRRAREYFVLDDPQGRGYRFSVKQNFRRRPPRLGRVFDKSPLYFVTFCTHRRTPFLACDQVHVALSVLPSAPSASSTSESAVTWSCLITFTYSSAGDRTFSWAGGSVF